MALRRNLFRLQQFEDSYVEKEVEIRKKLLKEYAVSLYILLYSIMVTLFAVSTKLKTISVV